MPYGGAAGHDTTRNLTLGHIASGAVLEGTPPPIPMRVVPRALFDAARGRMVDICRRCHSAGFARQALRDADEIKVVADGLVAEAAQIIRDLDRDGLLRPMPADRPPHPQAGHTLVLGGGQLYSDTSTIEQRFFEMSKFHHATTFKGAYHGSPDHTHWLGYAALQADLTAIRDEARRLRAMPASEGP
ncbi:MAG: multiheme c-type cytochrome [bacterium]